ncbi:tiar-3, partial [Pristionchus pacificus]
QSELESVPTRLAVTYHLVQSGRRDCTVKLKRSHQDDARGLYEDPDYIFLQAKKMMNTMQPMNAMQMAAGSAAALVNGTGSTVSTGTTPSSLCSTPNINLLSQSGANPMMQFMQQGYPTGLHQMQLPGVNAFEGIPFIIYPSGGVQQGISVAALQRVAESKTGTTAVTTEPKVDTSKHHHIFIGDLSSEIDVKSLKDAFAVHGEVSEAKVIRDAQTQKSKGYGFVSFPDRACAEKAIVAMNGHVLGRRAIRTNWATRRPSDEAREKLTFEQVFNSTKPDNTSVYVGNVHQNTSENDLREAFKDFGQITEVRIFKSQGYAFVRFEKKEDATKAIMEMNGKAVANSAIRCSWGRTQQTQSNAMGPLVTDMAPLFAAQQLLQQQAAAPYAAAAAHAQLLSPFWSPLQTQVYPKFLNPLGPLPPAPMLGQW